MLVWNHLSWMFAGNKSTRQNDLHGSRGQLLTTVLRTSLFFVLWLISVKINIFCSVKKKMSGREAGTEIKRRNEFNDAISWSHWANLSQVSVNMTGLQERGKKKFLRNLKSENNCLSYHQRAPGWGGVCPPASPPSGSASPPALSGPGACPPPHAPSPPAL